MMAVLGACPQIRRGVAIVAGALLLSACATLDRGETDDIPVQTTPSDAMVTSTTGTRCVSPCSVAAPRKETVVITIRKPGYATEVRLAESKRIAGTEGKASPAPSMDFLGRIVDASSHADFEHVPSVISVKLVALPAPR